MMYLMESDGRVPTPAGAGAVPGHARRPCAARASSRATARWTPAAARGGIAELMADLVGEGGHVTGVEPARRPRRGGAGSQRPPPHLTFLQADVRATGLPSNAFDYAWSQYVFEYLPDRNRALAELIRVTRPGGRVVVSDIDGLGSRTGPSRSTCAWAPSASWRPGVAGFDLHVGRKLFSDFRRAGLTTSGVHLVPSTFRRGPRRRGGARLEAALRGVGAGGRCGPRSSRPTSRIAPTSWRCSRTRRP